MPSKAVQISLDSDLLARIDRDPEARQRGRSAFIRSAVRRYLHAKARRRVDDDIRRAYKGRQTAMLEEITGLIGGQAWPKS